MARNDGFSTPDDDLATPPRARGSDSARGANRGTSSRAVEDDDVDPRLLDLDVEEESPFLRAQKRVPVRRGPLPRKAADRLKIATFALIGVGLAAFASYQLYRYGATSWRFRIESSDDIQIAGTEHVSRGQVMEVFGADLGRNIFFVPLDERRRQLEKIPWVESAAVMRLLPHRLKISVQERTPVAFAQVGSRIQLVDASGVLMDLPRSQKQYSFPVLAGMSDAEPLSTRAARMKIYTRVVQELDAEGARNSEDISEMDLRDPDDVKITVGDEQGAIVVHLGDSDFLPRFKIYKSHIQEWRQKFQKLESVDLRYEKQVIVNPDKSSAPSGGAASPAAERSGARGSAGPAPSVRPAGKPATPRKPAARKPAARRPAPVSAAPKQPSQLAAKPAAAPRSGAGKR